MTDSDAHFWMIVLAVGLPLVIIAIVVLSVRQSREEARQDRERSARVVELVGMIRDGVEDPSKFTSASAIVGRLSLSATDLAMLYQRSLDAVQSSKGAPTAKELALRLGRLSYAAGRPDKRPTVYDEQAVANDIAMRA
jgi:hypothetical protein